MNLRRRKLTKKPKGKPQPKRKGSIQAVLFKKVYYKPAEARRWLQGNRIQPIKPVHITENFLRYRISQPHYYRRLRTIPVTKTIQFIIGYI